MEDSTTIVTLVFPKDLPAFRKELETTDSFIQVKCGNRFISAPKESIERVLDVFPVGTLSVDSVDFRESNFMRIYDMQLNPVEIPQTP